MKRSIAAGPFSPLEHDGNVVLFQIVARLEQGIQIIHFERPMLRFIFATGGQDEPSG